MPQLQRTLRMPDGLIQRALPQTSIREHGMGTPGSWFDLHCLVEIPNRVARLVVPYERIAQREQSAKVVWSEDKDFFPIIPGVHPIVHLRGIKAKKKICIGVARSKPIDGIQVAARRGGLVGLQCFQWREGKCPLRKDVGMK